MTPNQAAAHMARMAGRLRRNLVDAEAQTARDAYARARVLSEGPFSSDDLARMGHPYAKRDPHPPADAALINVQRTAAESTGAFDAGWQVRLPQWQGDDIHTEVRNDSPVAGYLDQGTDRMIRRPLVARVLERVTPKRIARLQAAIRRALT